MSSIRTAVVGVGLMGHNHARVYSEIANSDLVGVVDVNFEHAKEIARRFGGQPYADVCTMLDKEKPEAITIAVPTVDHLEVAKEAIARGINILIEKPIAHTIEEGQQIIDMAHTAGVTLMIGHIERFNPAVIALKERLEADELGRVFQMDARRQGPFPARVRDVGVVIDLAVHDVDVMRYVCEAEVLRVFAETEQQVHSSYEDLLTGLMRMSNGAIGTLTINWLTPTKIRELYVTGERGMYRVDYLTQDLYFFENAVTVAPDWSPLKVLRGVSEGSMYRPVVQKKEPLLNELEAFLDAVRGDKPVAVSGSDGLKALAIAQSLVQAGLENKSVVLS